MRLVRAFTLLCFACTALAQTAPHVLPKALIHQAYYFQLAPPAHGTPPWHWRAVGGSLPPGISLDGEGVLAGSAKAPGEYHFELQAADSSPTPRTQTGQYVIVVPPPLVVQWTQPAHVTATGAIEGALRVTNGTGETVDLTVIVVAVNTVNKAFALGYQRVSLGPGAVDVPFGSTLPRDSYVVHADAIAEIAETYEIYRARLQTDPLTVQ